MCACTLRYTHMYMHVCICVDGQNHPSLLFHLIDWGRISQSNPEYTDMNNLTNHLSPDWDKGGVPPTQHLLGFWGSKLQSSGMCNKRFSHWAMVPVLDSAKELFLFLMYVYPSRPKEGLGSLGARVTLNCKMPDVGIRNRTWILQESSKHS